MKLEKNKDSRMFDFVITSSEPDKEGDVVPEDEIEEALDGWLQRGAPMSKNHKNLIIGKGLRWWKEDGKYLGRGQIHKDIKAADETWEQVKDGTLRSVSIGGGAFNKTPNATGGYDLNDLEILEVAVCESGMNQEANILDVNQIAKGATPFFMKAEISGLGVGGKTRQGKPKTDEERRQSHGEGKLPPRGTGLQKESTNLEVENMKKEEGNYVSQEQFAELASAVQALKEMLSAKPEEVQEQDEEEKPEEKPKEKEPEDEMAKEGGIGVKEVNPSPEGGEVTLPASVDDKRVPAGAEEAANEGGNDKEKLADKALVKKSTVVKASTPAPRAEIVQKKEEFPAWEIIKGTKTLDDFELDTKYKRMENELNARKAFEAQYKPGNGGN